MTNIQNTINNKEQKVKKSWYIGWALGLLFACLYWLHFHFNLSIGSYDGWLPFQLRTSILSYIILFFVFFVIVINSILSIITIYLHDEIGYIPKLFYSLFFIYWILICFIIDLLWGEPWGRRILIILGILFLIFLVILFNLGLMAFAT